MMILIKCRCVPAAVVVGAVLAAGCSRDPQAEMKRFAIKRKSDEGNTAPAASPSSKRPRKLDDDDQQKGPTRPAGPPPNQVAQPQKPAAEGSKIEPVVEPRQRPDHELSKIERRQWAIDSITDVSRALERYNADNGVYPVTAIKDSGGSPVLSWRVKLLPYLGHEELYQKFKLSQPWDSPHNRELLSEIPPIYQSPERFDDNTNFLVPVGSSTLFRKDRPVASRRIEDSLEATIMLLEVDDELAIPWTKPGDYEVSSPFRGLGHLREDGFFVAFGGGLVRRVPVNVNPAELLGAFSIGRR